MVSGNQLYEEESLLEGLLRWVEIDTPTGDVEGMARLLDVVTRDYEGIGALVERIPGRNGLGDHILVRMPWGRGPGILSVAHLDTVCSPGYVRIHRDGDRFYGPGIADMKGGGYLAFAAARALATESERAGLPFAVLYNSDEEIGSPTSRDIIESLARESRFALIAEPARRDEVVTFRKGRSKYSLQAHGRASHAGSAHAQGRNAISEIASQIVELDKLTDYATGTTINVGQINGGTATNVVAEFASCDIDVRFERNLRGSGMHEHILNLAPLTRDIDLKVSGDIERPCFERSEATVALFDLARAEAKRMGVDLTEFSSGGVSDGNLTAAMGTPTLDGLGVIGNNWHSPDEHILVSALPRRAALIDAMLTSLR